MRIASVYGYDYVMGAERTPTMVRLSESGRVELDKIAETWHVTRSEVIRIILGAAIRDTKWLNAHKPMKEVM